MKKVDNLEIFKKLAKKTYSKPFAIFTEDVLKFRTMGAVSFQGKLLFKFGYGKIIEVPDMNKFNLLSSQNTNVKVKEIIMNETRVSRDVNIIIIAAPKENKFGAKKITVDGITFDSQKEAARWQELKTLERAGKIHALERQAKYVLIPKQMKDDGTCEREVCYIADFVYRRNDTRPMDNDLVVEDVKGLKKGAAYQVYVLKRKMMLYRYGIEIKEL